jgi:hypothetical protein
MSTQITNMSAPVPFKTLTNVYTNDTKGSAGRICHLENVKSYMSYLQQYTKIIKKLTLKTYFS